MIQPRSAPALEFNRLPKATAGSYPENLVELTTENVQPYLGFKGRVTALGGGVSNTVLMVESGTRRWVVKQSLERLRVDQDWRSDRSRIFGEASALQACGELLPDGCVPRVVFEDHENFVFAMTAAPPSAEMWKTRLFRGEIEIEIAHRIGRILGTMISKSWFSDGFREKFGDQTVFNQLRIDPYYRTTALRHPDLAGRIEDLIARSQKRKVSIVHGDWSPKNFLVSNGSLMIIDFEVVHFGDPSFDAAFLLNHLLLKSFVLPQWGPKFFTAALAFWDALGESIPTGQEWFEPATLAHLGALFLARIDGKSPVEYITDEDLRRRIRLDGRKLIMNPPSSIREIFHAHN